MSTGRYARSSTLPVHPPLAKPNSIRRGSLFGHARAWLALALVVLTLGGVGSSAQPADSTEYEVKAAFLFKFTTYVKWPDRAFEKPVSPIVVAVVGPDPFGRALDDAFKEKAVGSRKVQVARFKTSAELGACHLLFVASQEAPKLSKILEQLATKPVLVVGESDGFATKGGCINFVLEDKKMRFEINPDAAKRAEVEISSQLLKLARIVKEEGAR